TTLRLLVDVYPDRTVVAENGIHAPADVALLRRHGVQAFLVGQAFWTTSVSRSRCNGVCWSPAHGSGGPLAAFSELSTRPLQA
ncbi:MAG: hypothetical protein ACREYC_17540, partial [Gammaproteobacteria bacterium]